ncbi:MAG TPA: histidine kinase [Verrucomicrobiae bacterium]|nr:histidine kinase [Verrucomicrobiae bacterium]
MKRKLTKLSRRYASALRKHVKKGPARPGCPQATLQSARGLGREAARLGLETLDMAKIHDGALAAMEASSSKNGIIKRAEVFFKEAVTPIEQTHEAAMKANARLTEVNKALDRRTVDLASANRSLKRSVIRRKTVEKALERSGGQSKKLLEESDRLQKHLRYLTQQILTAQENKRKKMSSDLQDEIAQTLLGINVRLLTLRKEAAANASGFKKEITSTQRLVDKAGKSIKRFAREIGKHHEA